MRRDVQHLPLPIRVFTVFTAVSACGHSIKSWIFSDQVSDLNVTLFSPAASLVGAKGLVSLDSRDCEIIHRFGHRRKVRQRLDTRTSHK